MSNAHLSLVPTETPEIAGVAVDVVLRHDVPLYLILLIGRDGNPVRTVAATPDEAAAERVWRVIAQRLEMPRLIADPAGGFAPLRASAGPLRINLPFDRRGRARRPSSRRSTGNAAAGPVHRGEREIACYE